MENFKPKPFSVLLLLLLLIVHRQPQASSSPDNSKLIYKGCADQQFQDPSGDWTENLRSLFDSLTSQSRKTNFSETTAGEEGKSQIFGLYQCRGDLSGIDCHDCVSQFPKLSRKLCGEAIASRIQFLGCYMRYEVVGFKQVSSTELLYKYCKPFSSSSSSSSSSSTSASASSLVGSNIDANVNNSSNSGFDEKREIAFEEVEKGVVGNGGFYTSNSGGVVVLGQCEGDLLGRDCGDCVRTALERVKAECGEAISGQVYLNRCYVSYTYYPNGIEQEAKEISSSGRGQRTEKTAAIVVGAIAGGGFLLVLLSFTRSVLKKKEASNKHAAPAYTDYIYS